MAEKTTEHDTKTEQSAQPAPAVDVQAEVAKILSRFDKAADRFERHIKAEDRAQAEALAATQEVLAAVTAAALAAKTALERIEQLPNEQHLERGPIAREALAVLDGALQKAR